MSVKIRSTTNLLTDYLLAALRGSKEEARGAEQYQNPIEFVIAEMVRGEMREQAKAGDFGNDWRAFLRGAIGSIRENIAAQSRTLKIPFDGEQYYRRIETLLEYPAREMFQLGQDLQLSRQSDKIPRPKHLRDAVEATPTGTAAGRGREIEMHELGLRGAIEGLWVRPVASEFELYPELIKEPFQVKGDWFPFEVSVEEFVFVIDDDGSIFVPTEGLPHSVIARVRRHLEELTAIVYG